MTFRFHIMPFLLVAVLVLGSLVHSTGAAAMTVAMASADVGGMHMPDCDGCSDENANGACDFVCGMQFAATFVPAAQPRPPVGGRGMNERVFSLYGLNGPPDPHPPRTHIPT